MRVWVEATARTPARRRPCGQRRRGHGPRRQPARPRSSPSCIASRCRSTPTSSPPWSPLPPTDLTAKKHVSIAWPMSRLLAPGADRRFLGYLMPRVHDTRFLYEIFNPRMRQQAAPSFHFAHLLRVARNLSAAVRGAARSRLRHRRRQRVEHPRQPHGARHADRHGFLPGARGGAGLPLPRRQAGVHAAGVAAGALRRRGPRPGTRRCSAWRC